MNNLSISNNEVLTMSSLEIAELTEKQHKHVIADIRKLCFSLDIDSAEFSAQYKDQSGKANRSFELPKRECLILISGYNVKLRASIIDRWQELETNQQPQIPTNFAEALQLAADQAKQLELAAPKVAFVDNFVESSGTKTFRQVAKILKVNERLFRAFLSAEGFMYKIGREWTAYQKHIDAGRFSCTVGEKNGHAFTECKFTPKGIEYIAGKWITASST